MLWEFLRQEKSIEKKMKKNKEILDSFGKDNLDETQVRQLKILIWKSIVRKSEFAHGLAVYLIENIDRSKKNFIIPEYIKKAIIHLTTYKF